MKLEFYFEIVDINSDEVDSSDEEERKNSNVKIIHTDGDSTGNGMLPQAADRSIMTDATVTDTS